MSRLFVGNFEFEHQLAGRDSPKPPHRTAVELASAWIAIAGENDVLWVPEPPEADFPKHLSALGFPEFRWASSPADLEEIAANEPLSLCPWGWSAQMIDWADEHNLPIDPPPLDAVRSANSRRFSFGLERELGIGLDRAEEIASVEVLETTLKKFSGGERWVLKSEFGMSARERVLGRGPDLSANQWAWVRKRLRSGQILILEPWVAALAEAGLQFEIPKVGEPECLGITPMFTDEIGVYRGSRFDPSPGTESDWSEAVAIGRTIARRAQDLGYFGPLGIDAMRYQGPEGVPVLRPVQDVNARWTMGRLSLGFRSRLAPGETGAWLHLTCPAATADVAREWWNKFADSLPSQVRLLRTSPLMTGGQVTRHATAILLAPDADLLQTAVLQALAR